MIILIDNENYMIRLCEKDPNIYGFHPSFPNWKQLVKFLSDTNHMVVLSGEVQEKWLDENNIYYVHVEKKAKENFENFKKRMNRLIEENRENIDSSLSFGKLHFALKADGEKGSVDTLNVVEVWRLNEDDKYHFAICLPKNDGKLGRLETAYKVESIATKFAKWAGFEHTDEKEREVLNDIAIDIITGKDFNLYTADTLTEVYGKLMLIAENCAIGEINAEELNDDAEDNPITACYKDMDSVDGLDWILEDLSK